MICAVHDQVAAGLDVITDGEQTRLDFNLSFYGYLEGIIPEPAVPRRFGPPAHDQRGRHPIVGELRAPRGLGVVEEWRRLRPARPGGTDAQGAASPGPTRSAGGSSPAGTIPTAGP